MGGYKLKKDTQMRLILGTLLLFCSNLNMAIKRSKMSVFGWTIDPQILFTTKNRDDLRRKIAEALTYFRVKFSDKNKTQTVIVSKFKEIKRLSQQIELLDQEIKGVFSRRFEKEWGAFLSIVELYGEEKHHQQAIFLEILDMRKEFMPRALSRREFVEKHLGDSSG